MGRLVAVLLAVSVTACAGATSNTHSKTTAAKVAPIEATQAKQRGQLTPGVVVLRDDAPERQVRSALVDKRSADALSIAERHLSDADALTAGRLRWLASKAAVRSGNKTKATLHLTKLARMSHPLSGVAATMLAESDSVPDVEVTQATPTVSTPSASTRQRIASATRHYNDKRFRSAQRAFSRLARSLPLGSKTRCDARLMEGKAMLKQRDRAKGSKLLIDVADVCTETDTRAWARYLAGRARGRIGNWASAIEQYNKLERQAPDHRLADDAAFRKAKAYLELGQRTKAEATLRQIPTRYADGDMWYDALFKLGWDARSGRRYEAALGHFDKLVTRAEPTGDEARVGQAAYWRARTLSDLGRAELAAEAYKDLALKWPLRYYGQLALWRLERNNSPQARAILKKMRHDGDEPLAFPWRPEFDRDEFTTAIELLKTGETSLATKLLHDLKMAGPDAKGELALVGASLLQHSQDKLDSSMRYRFSKLSGLLPVGEARTWWELAYPLAYSPEIEKAAKREDLPASFVRAIAREESSFDPEAVSWAKAYGLVQLILPTAKRFAKEVKARATPRTLKNPKTNLKIGARYMSWLWERHRKAAAFVAAAYNAGDGAVRRWMNELDHDTIDEFVEQIPYDETRRYTRRVLQTYGVYSWLYEDKLPQIAAKKR